jgi:hypothetical protein
MDLREGVRSVPARAGRGSAPTHPAEWRDDRLCRRGRPWMWVSAPQGQIARAAHGFEATRETTI